MTQPDALQELVSSAQASFAQANTPADLENAKAQFLGKAGRVTELMKGMATLSVEEKKSRGAAINLAARLREHAQPGEIVIGEATYHHTRRAFGLSPRLVEAKGFPTPVRAFLVERRLERPERPARATRARRAAGSASRSTRRGVPRAAARSRRRSCTGPSR